MAELLDQVYLAGVVLPEGARQVPSVAGDLSRIPDFHGSFLCGGAVVPQDRYWSVPEALSGFDAFIAEHPPTGERQDFHLRSMPQFPDVHLRGYAVSQYYRDLENERVSLFYLPIDATHTGVRAMATSAGTGFGCMGLT